MATYAIGDIQGCHGALMRLLERIGFAGDDRLWLVGDLVNRGPQSAEVLRWAKDLGDRVVAVLGNHDLHLIARAHGASGAKARDTIEDVLGAPDRDELVRWLITRPLVHRDGDHVMVHAGLLPSWDVAQAEALAREAEAALVADPVRLLAGKQRPQLWDESLSGEARARLVLAVMTRLRTCTAGGVMCDFDGPPEEAPPGCLPWFRIPGRRSADTTIVFGHWAALGLDVGERHLGLDTGCVWGGALTAVRLEDRALFSVPAAG